MERASTLLFGAMLALGLATQGTPEPQVPRLRTRVDSVLVDVYPTRDGRAVGDLTKDDFELLEDGVPQRIEMFERVAARLPGSHAERSEPSTVAESNDAAGDPRNRLFVLYLDTYHTPQDRRPDGSQLTRQTTDVDVQIGTAPAASAGLITNALSSLLFRLIGPDDLVGMYTPEMSISQISFTRGPGTIDDFLRKAPWQRFGTAEYDFEPRERMWRACYPKQGHDPMVYEMIARRRQAMALDGVRNLVAHLQNIREGRTAVLLVSTGWRLYRTNKRLAMPIDGRIPTPPGINVSPQGKLTVGDTQPDRQILECDRDRQALADLDNARDFDLILQGANRANVTFYPIDPAGPREITGQAAPWAIAAGQPETLRTMASATDGIAIVGTTDIDVRARRIIDDVSSYYLLGYTPTNTRHDGKLRTIAVRVKRGGVTVRARSGYRALTQAEATSPLGATTTTDPAGVARDAALAALAAARDGRSIRLAAGYGWDTGGSSGTLRPVLWVAGELDSRAPQRAEWAVPRHLSITVTQGRDVIVATERATLSTSAPRFLVRLNGAAVVPGDYVVRVGAQGDAASGSAATEQARVTLPRLPAESDCGLGVPLLYRRGPSSGPGFQPTTDPRFRRAERLRADVPIARPCDASFRLLDRRGQALPLPVAAGQREETSALFVTGELGLAPLAPADYLIEMTVRRGEREELRLVAFRIVP